jgi:hypothetical protein
MTSINPSRTFKLRKLCSSTEEYEANAGGPIDLELLALRLHSIPGVELSAQERVLTVLFEDQGVAVRLFPDGRALVQAGLREDAELVCSMLSRALADHRARDPSEMV